MASCPRSLEFSPSPIAAFLFIVELKQLTPPNFCKHCLLMGRFWTLLTHAHSLAGPLVMLVYPLYASVMAMESTTKVDDEQWLAYWILYSFLTLMEMLLQPLLQWIPIWYDVKLILAAWLVLPQFRGAAFLYEKLVREQLRKHHTGSNSNKKGSGNGKRKKFVDFITPKKGEQEAY